MLLTVLFSVAECNNYKNPVKDSILIMATEGEGFEESKFWHESLEKHIGCKSIGKILSGQVTQP